MGTTVTCEERMETVIVEDIEIGSSAEDVQMALCEALS